MVSGPFILIMANLCLCVESHLQFLLELWGNECLLPSAVDFFSVDAVGWELDNRKLISELPLVPCL